MMRVTKLARYEIDMVDFRKAFPDIDGNILSIRIDMMGNTVDVEVEL
jgi:hypothetical protein